MNKTIKWGIIAIFAILLISFIGCGVSQSNREIDLRTAFEQKTSERTAFYDKLWKTITQKGQVAEKNKQAGIEAINAAMAARVDSAAGKLVTFVVEANPNVDPRERQELYKDLSRTIESERAGFFEQEKSLQDIKRQHDMLLRKFPSVIIMGILGRKPLEYKPITSDRTDDVIKTGKDNNVNVF